MRLAKYILMAILVTLFHIALAYVIEALNHIEPKNQIKAGAFATTSYSLFLLIIGLHYCRKK